MIPLLDLRRSTSAIRGEIDAAIARVLDHAQFILGPEVGELESKFAEFCEAEFAVACASGSDAILLALMALGVTAGDKVITTPFSFFATAGSIAHLGAIPVFVDIDPATFNLDPARLDAALARDRERVKAIMPVHLFGQCAEMRAINDIAGRYNIPVIEDAAQAVGARIHGKTAGSIGLCGCFSFFPTKNLGGFGDGGIITTNNRDLAEKLRIIRVHGSRTRYYHEQMGVNSRLDTLQAAILLVKLGHLQSYTAGRQRNAALYRELLQGLPIQLPVELRDAKHVYNQFTIRTPHRDDVKRELASLGVGSEVYYPVPLHLQACFASLGYVPGSLPYSEAAAREVLSVPIESGLETDDIKNVASLLARAVESAMCAPSPA